MPAPRPFALIRTHDQWLRAAHQDTALLGEVVQLYWQNEQPAGSESTDGFLQRGAGLAFDRYCRLYHSKPEQGQVERLLWSAQDPLQIATPQPAPVDLFASTTDEQLGDFSISGQSAKVLREPRGLAVSDDDRLFIAEAGARRILIYDLYSKRLLRQVPLAAAPVDLVAAGDSVYALLADLPWLIRLDARSEPQPQPWPDTIVDPARIAIAAHGALYILEQSGKAQARIVHYQQPQQTLAVAFATDLEFQHADPLLAQACSGASRVLVVARRPGEDFLRFCIDPNTGETAGLPPLKARAYDGLGIIETPDGRIGFWTAAGFRHAVAARLRYLAQGSVITYRLDSGEFHTQWGRLFIDACIPRDTAITLRCISADEPPQDTGIARTLPANSDSGVSVAHPELSPPLPAQSLAGQLAQAPAQVLQLLGTDLTADNIGPQTLYRRETGPELPWLRPAANDSFVTYEAPLLTAPGRYLWICMELRGNTRTTPRLRALRAEYPGHDYLRRLPQTFSRDERTASFLQRYLAMFEGMLGDFEAKADARRALLDARSAPAEILPWLAGFVGLTLDERMARAPRPGGSTEDVRRTLISEAVWLFRLRGTLPGLRRFLEIYLGVQPILLEKFRVRGLGGVLLGAGGEFASSSVLGAGFRIGGAIGEDTTVTLNGSTADAFATHAHRFAVIIPAQLTTEQADVVNRILEAHRPAHTLVEVCTVDAGMRVGRGLHIALTSIIGRSSGFSELQIGSSALGRGAIVGRPQAGTLPGASRLGRDSRIA